MYGTHEIQNEIFGDSIGENVWNFHRRHQLNSSFELHCKMDFENCDENSEHLYHKFEIEATISRKGKGKNS